MLKRCLSTLDTTKTPIMRWINSINDTYYANTFTRCQRQSSLDKYFRTWKELISYLFRVHHFDQRDRDTVYGRVYSEDVAERLTMAWELELTDDTTRDALAVQLFNVSIISSRPHTQVAAIRIAQ